MADRSQNGEPGDTATESPPPSQLAMRARAKTWPVTIVNVDIVGSAPLTELGSDAYKDVIERFQQEGRRIIREYGGFARAYGDAVIGIFGVPVKGDDALRAVNVAVRLRGQVLPALNDELHRNFGVKLGIRIGVHTDEAPVETPGSAPLSTSTEDLRRDDQLDVQGKVMIVAQRLQANAAQGQILIGQGTYQRVRAWVTVDKGRTLKLKGMERPVAAWALFTVYSQPRLRLASVPMVGRADELAQLNISFQRTRRSRRLHFATVIGEAGVGKTRLLQEFVGGLGEQARVLQGQCQQHGEAGAYGPITQMLQQAADIPAGLSPDAIRTRLEPLAGDDPHRAAQLASLLWLKDSAAEPEAMLRALREGLRLLARRRPLVLVIEDLQWARETLLDFISDIGVSLQLEPVLVVCAARPEFLDDQPHWGTRYNTVTFEMDPLDSSEVEELVRHLLHEGEPDPELLEYMLAAPDRSPLSIQLLIAVLEEDKLIALRDGRWRVARDLAEVGELARTIDVVRARLDRLSTAEQATLEGAAVIGASFLQSDVYELVEGSDPPIVERLVRKNLLQPGRPIQGLEGEDPWVRLYQPAGENRDAQASAIPSTVGDDELYSFAHPLVREAAYQRLSNQDRGRLHERYASIFEQRFPKRSAPIQLLIGNHLEQAYQAYRRSGKPNALLGPLALRAGRELARAGHQGVIRGGLTPTVQSVLRRSIELLPAGHEQRLTAQLDLARTLLAEADLSTAAGIYREVVSTAQQTGNELAEAAARLWELETVAFNDPDRALREGSEILQRAFEVYEGTDNPSLAKARYMSFYLDFMAGRLQAAALGAERARQEAAQAGDIRLEATIRRLQCVVVFWGPAPLQEVLDQAEQAIAWARTYGMYSLAAGAHNIAARALAMQGRFDEARERNVQARRLLAGLDELLTLGSSAISEGLVEWYAAELDAAERILRQGWDELVRRGGERGQLSVAALLARVLLRQPRERHNEAAWLIDRCQQEASEGQRDIQIKWRQLRAILLAHGGRLEEAKPLAHEAVRLARASEQPDSQAEACFDLAGVLRQRGELADARASAEQALGLYEAKGNLVSAGRVRRFLLELS